MNIKETIAFIKAIAPNLNTSTLEGSFDKNHEIANDDNTTEVTAYVAKAHAQTMFRELSKRYIEEVREMGFRTIPH